MDFFLCSPTVRHAAAFIQYQKWFPLSRDRHCPAIPWKSAWTFPVKTRQIPGKDHKQRQVNGCHSPAYSHGNSFRWRLILHPMQRSAYVAMSSHVRHSGGKCHVKALAAGIHTTRKSPPDQGTAPVQAGNFSEWKNPILAGQYAYAMRRFPYNLIAGVRNGIFMSGAAGIGMNPCWSSTQERSDTALAVSCNLA